jgi:dCTP deaminase
VLLSDEEIEKYVDDDVIGLDPYNPDRLQPTSVDLTLDAFIRTPTHYVADEIDVAAVPEGHTKLVEIPDEGYVLAPGHFILASTCERVRLPPFLAARVEGKSSVGRLGLAIHITAGFIDPGFDGNVTLEMYNFAPWPIRLRVGMPIGQICFMVCTPPRNDYSVTGHYQGQRGPTESRYKIS